MSRRIAEGALSFCVVLLMFGTSAVAQDSGDAEDRVVFDLSALFTKADAAPDDAEELILIAETDDPASPADSARADEADVPQAEDYFAPPDVMPPAPMQDDGFSLWRRPPPTYPLPSRSFSLFQSPASYGWDYFERCCPTPFTPRGDGIPKRTSCYRMDYRPYTLEHTESKHGPAFYQRHELYPCEECHFHRHRLQRYYGLR